MFLQPESEICKYDERCSRILCPYRHSDLNREANSDDHTNKDNNDDDENMWECQVCDFKALLYIDDWEHIDNNHLEDADA